jgi:type I restriction enzyme, S subunit
MERLSGKANDLMTSIKLSPISLPIVWSWTKLEHISERINPGFPSGKHNKENRGIPHIRPMNISPKGHIDLSNVKYVEESDYEKLLKGDILFNNTNSPEMLGKTTYLKQDTNWAYSNHMTRIRLFLQYLEPAWVAFYLHHLFLNGFFKMNCVHHVNQASINSGFLSQKVPIPLAPFREQQRIIAKIEELFSCLDAGVVALQKAKAQLQRYRQSVLKAAVEGRLTAEWRKMHPEVEPSESLLKQIAEKRHNGKRKTNETLNCDLYDLPSLPDIWTWTRIGDISEQIQYGTSEKAGEDPVGIPVIRMGNIQEGKLAFEKLKYMPRDFPEADKFFLRDGDVLFNRTNSAELVGKTAVYKKCHPKSVFASYLIRIEVDKSFYNPDFLSCFINSTYGRKYIAAVVSQQVGQANVNGTKLASMTIPLPSIEEQAKIVEYVDRYISESAETEVNIERIQFHTNYLRQSILKHAFEGKLVPQDPNDEPASALLERIRAERANGSPRRGKKSSINTNQMRLPQ